MSASHRMVQAWAIEKFKLPKGSVVRVEQEVEFGGGCETCYYEETVVNVYYTPPGGKEQRYRYWDDMASMLNEVLDFAMEANGSS